MDTQLLVVGAGPYGLSAAAHAQDWGINTLVLGVPMAFWREHMPPGMFLRSGSDCQHLDTDRTYTLEAYLEERGITIKDVDPLPIRVFLDYADWFRQTKHIDVQHGCVTDLTKSPDGRFEATLNGDQRITADAVLAAPGIRYFTNLPSWAGLVPPKHAAHTCDLVSFEELSGARVLIVGGRQSAYEWAALIGEHGAERIDIVHRHDMPRFERVNLDFIDSYLDNTIRVRGWWRNLPKTDRDGIIARFWRAGRLTLEAWLPPRLARSSIHCWPNVKVIEAGATSFGDAVAVRLSNGEELVVDQVIFASGYRVDLSRVPYLAGVLRQIRMTEGFPILNDFFESTLPGFYVAGFAASRDFGPFFGSVNGVRATTTVIIRDLLARH